MEGTPARIGIHALIAKLGVLGAVSGHYKRGQVQAGGKD